MTTSLSSSSLVRVFAVLLLSLPLAMQAQFNGPADTARDTVNAPHPITTDPAILYPPAHNVRIQTGDSLRFTIYGVPDYTALDRVSAEGAVSLPLLSDPIPLEGLTVLQAEATIAKTYVAAGMFEKPQVRIEITDSPKSIITLFGEVRGNASAPSGNRRLFDVLASNGGLPATASHVINIDRPGQLESINIDLGSDPEQSKYANIPVFAGDTITTSNIGKFYLVGAFKNPGVVGLTSNAPLTMMQMLAAGGGRLWEAKLDQVHIIRTIGTQRTVVTVNLKAALKGTGPDPVIQNDDIIIAPSNLLKQAIRNGGASTILGLGLTFYSLLRY